MSATYNVNEIYYTIHGEGVRAGIPHVFVRLSQCNLMCNFCDTEYESGVPMDGGAILNACKKAAELTPPQPDAEVGGAKIQSQPIPPVPCNNVLFCGGEPLLQLDADLIGLFKHAGWHISVETNGTRPCPDGVDWITCSPKVAEHALKLDRCNELKYVRAANQGIPRPKIRADHYLLSPVFEGNGCDRDNIAHCIRLVKDNPQWKMTIQLHKFWAIR